MDHNKYAQVNEDFEKVFASRHWAIATQDAILAFVHAQIDKMVAAFGGCLDCYGKGYATTRETATGYDEYSGQEYNQQLPLIRFCTCDRGMQAKMYFGKKEQ